MVVHCKVHLYWKQYSRQTNMYPNTGNWSITFTLLIYTRATKFIAVLFHKKHVTHPFWNLQLTLKHKTYIVANRYSKWKKKNWRNNSRADRLIQPCLPKYRWESKLYPIWICHHIRHKTKASEAKHIRRHTKSKIQNILGADGSESLLEFTKNWILIPWKYRVIMKSGKIQKPKWN